MHAIYLLEGSLYHLSITSKVVSVNLLGFIASRFVMLEDCGHVIEAEAMKNLMDGVTSKIGFQKCPQCLQPIYNNRRHRSAIINTYEDVRKVKTKYNTSSKKYSITRKSIEVVLQGEHNDWVFLNILIKLHICIL